MAETEKFISDELEEEGFTQVDPKEFNPSDGGEVAERLVDFIAGKEIIEKGLKRPHITPREAEILKKRFLEGKTRPEIGRRTKSKLTGKKGISPGTVMAHENRAIESLRKFLPKSLTREIENSSYRSLAKNLISQMYPSDKNRFLMVEYLVEYFTKNGYKEFSDAERAALSTIVSNGNKKDMVWYMHYHFIDDKGDCRYKEEELANFLTNTFDKVKQIVERKFNKMT